MAGWIDLVDYDDCLNVEAVPVAVEEESMAEFQAMVNYAPGPWTLQVTTKPFLTVRSDPEGHGRVRKLPTNTVVTVHEVSKNIANTLIGRVDDGWIDLVDYDDYLQVEAVPVDVEDHIDVEKGPANEDVEEFQALVNHAPGPWKLRVTESPFVSVRESPEGGERVAKLATGMVVTVYETTQNHVGVLMGRVDQC